MYIRTPCEIWEQTVSYQLSRGQMTLLAVSEQVSRQLHGHLTYFLPGGGGAMGWAREGGREGGKERDRDIEREGEREEGKRREGEGGNVLCGMDTLTEPNWRNIRVLPSPLYSWCISRHDSGFRGLHEWRVDILGIVQKDSVPKQQPLPIKKQTNNLTITICIHMYTLHV